MSKNSVPAFPSPNFIVPQDLSDKGVQRLGETQGMSLRDYFAAKAMQAILSNPSIELLQPSELASDSYNMADAMLIEKENRDE